MVVKGKPVERRGRKATGLRQHTLLGRLGCRSGLHHSVPLLLHAVVDGWRM
jgi:hypothetical protein